MTRPHPGGGLHGGPRPAYSAQGGVNGAPPARQPWPPTGRQTMARNGTSPTATSVESTPAGKTSVSPASTGWVRPSSVALALPSSATKISSRVIWCGTGWAPGNSSSLHTLLPAQPGAAGTRREPPHAVLGGAGARACERREPRTRQLVRRGGRWREDGHAGLPD